jgi:hypothetical protein
MSEAAECADDGLPLRVENLGFGHHGDNYPRHSSPSYRRDADVLLMSTDGAALILPADHEQEPG